MFDLEYVNAVQTLQRAASGQRETHSKSGQGPRLSEADGGRFADAVVPTECPGSLATEWKPLIETNT